MNLKKKKENRKEKVEKKKLLYQTRALNLLHTSLKVVRVERL